MQARMVDISNKAEVSRLAIAEGKIFLKPTTIEAIKDGRIEKGDVVATASLAAINAVKKTSELLFHCHPVNVTSVEPEFEFAQDGIVARVRVKAIGRTGVEMEALVGTSVALLTIWDMVKALEKDDRGQYPTTRISEIRVVEKVKNEL